MPIRILMTGPDADQELGSLYVWLQEEPDVRRHARLSLVPTDPAATGMGSTFDIIQLVVDGGFQALNLALAYTTWRATRPRHPKVTIECEGAQVNLDDDDPDTVEAIVRALR